MPAPQDHPARVAALQDDAELSGLTAPSSGSDSSRSLDRSFDRSMDRSVDYGIAAPTPYNTYIEPTTSQTDSVYVGAPTQSFLSDTGSHYLTPTYSARQSDYEVPLSSRPVPAPPQLRATPSENELEPVMSPDTTRTTRSSIAPDPAGRIKGLGFLSRRSSKTVVDRDTQRLQQLGYDAVLGRNYTFWSSLALAWLNINSLQVRPQSAPSALPFLLLVPSFPPGLGRFWFRTDAKTLSSPIPHTTHCKRSILWCCAQSAARTTGAAEHATAAPRPETLNCRFTWLTRRAPSLPYPARTGTAGRP